MRLWVRPKRDISDLDFQGSSRAHLTSLKSKMLCHAYFAGYMTRSSYGIYIVHYLPVAALGYMMKTYTQLPPWSMYAILFVAVLTLSPLLYEVLRRIPLVRWCILGEKHRLFQS